MSLAYSMHDRATVPIGINH